MPSNVLPLHLKQSFLTIIWIFTEGEGDRIKSRLPFTDVNEKFVRVRIIDLGLKLNECSLHLYFKATTSESLSEFAISSSIFRLCLWRELFQKCRFLILKFKHEHNQFEIFRTLSTYYSWSSVKNWTKTKMLLHSFNFNPQQKFITLHIQSRKWFKR